MKGLHGDAELKREGKVGGSPQTSVENCAQNLPGEGSGGDEGQRKREPGISRKEGDRTRSRGYKQP